MKLTKDNCTKLTGDIHLLDKCISHWKRDNLNLDNPDDISTGPHECALCMAYSIPHQNSTGCLGCPIYDDTNGAGCRDTPYTRIDPLEDEWYAKDEKPSNFERVVQDEIDYLTNLRDKLQIKLNNFRDYPY